MIIEDQWRIFQDKENAWNWKKMDHSGRILKQSDRGFNTRTDCLENARRYGYLGN